MARPKSHFPCVTTAGGLLPQDFLVQVKSDTERQSTSKIPGLRPEDYHLSGETFGEATNRAWNTLQGRWEHFKTYLDEKDDHDTTHGETWNRFLRPLFSALDYGQLERDLSVEIDSDTYKISHHWREVPIHLIGANVSIDKRTPGVEGAAKKSPHAMIQEFLNRSDDHLWAFVSNGLHLRILRDNVSLTRQAYVEFDLYAMFEGGEYADFQLLWLLCHQSRVEGTPPETCWLEKWATEAKQLGVRMHKELRTGVKTAINSLGKGFLQHGGNTVLRERLESGDLSTQDYYRQVLRIVYRLIFIFVAEDRNLLLDPDADEEAKERYRKYYATDRLRELAQKRRGTIHPDLWEQLKIVMHALGSPEGQPALGLPALGSFLWDAERSTPELANITLSNNYFLDAIRALSTIKTAEEKVQRVVDYQNLGAEELGSVYESLLELHPQINLDARSFALDIAAGNERKTSGSYYTPDSLVQCLLDTALEPVIKDRLAEARKANHANSAEAKAAAQQRALLDLKVCDPAVGSGHFLIGAGHRIARHLARIRSGEEEPSPADYQDALRDVVGRCLYGVDIKPMTVELCKVSLWIEAMEPGKPLSFLDHHIRCGNSLLGTTPTLIAKGIPDGAYKALTGDEKEACAFLKKRNKGEREGVGGLFKAEDTANLDALRSAAEAVESIADDSITALQRKEKEYRKAETSDERLQRKQIADLWCAAFVWEKKALEENAEGKCTKATGVSTSHLQQLAKDGTLSDYQIDQLRKLVEDYQFFHWHVEFPGVFTIPSDEKKPEYQDSGLFGGFDAMLGNPPWERVKLQEKEWFAAHSPEIASAPSAADRKRMITKLKAEDPFIYADFLIARRQAEGVSHVLHHEAGVYPLCGRGDINLYTVFAELFREKLRPFGRFGAVLPTGIATDDTTKYYFQDLVERYSLCSFYDFENKEKLFAEVHPEQKFCLLTAGSPMQPTANTADFAFFCHSVDDLRVSGRVFSLSPEDIILINPNTRTCPIFQSTGDAELCKAIYRRVPVLIRESSDDQSEKNPWEIKFSTTFHMSNDSNLFITKNELETLGYSMEGNKFEQSGETPLVPLYEGKLFDHFNHRYATFCDQSLADIDKGNARESTTVEHCNPRQYAEPHFWINSDSLTADLTDYVTAFRIISNPNNARTYISTIIPTQVAGNSAGLFQSKSLNGRVASQFLGAQNCFAIDWVSRKKLASRNFNFFVVRQLPSLTPERTKSVASQIESPVLELTYTAWDLEPFAKDCGYDGPPFRWDENRRFQLRCELDALFFHLYLPCDDAGDWKPARIAEDAVRDETDEELATLKSHFPTPRDAVDYIMETFLIVKKKDLKRTAQLDEEGNPIEDTGTFITKDSILEIYDQMLQARRESREWQSPLDPPPGPPTDTEGNFIPMTEWSEQPSHIHPDKSNIPSIEETPSWRDRPLHLVATTRSRMHNQDAYRSALFYELIHQAGGSLPFTEFRKAYWLLTDQAYLKQLGQAEYGDIITQWSELRDDTLTEDDFMHTLRGSITGTQETQLYRSNEDDLMIRWAKEPLSSNFPAIIDDARLALTIAELWQDEDEPLPEIWQEHASELPELEEASK